MGRKVNVDDLVGATEIALRLGIDRKSVHQLRRRHSDFPEPIAQLESALIWSWPDIERWARTTSRLA